jgi:hypothetical protein
MPAINYLPDIVPHSNISAMPDDLESRLISRAMSALGKRRWAGTTAEQRQEALAKVQAARSTGRGKDRKPRQLTAEQRADIGKRLKAARQVKRKSQ